MARYGITYEQVVGIADDLLRQKVSPTIELIRRQLGTGSNTTLSKHLNTWRAERMKQVIQEETQKISPPDEIRQAVTHVWSQLRDRNQAEKEALKKETEEALAQLMHERDALKQANQALEETLNKLSIKVNHLETDNTILRKKLNEQQQVLTLAEEREKQLNGELINFKQQMEQMVSDLKASHTQALEQLKTFNTKETDTFKTIIENQRTDFMVKVDALTIARDKAEKALIKTELELQQYQQKFQSLNEEKKLLEVDLKVANSTLQEQAQQLADAEKEVLQTKLQHYELATRENQAATQQWQQNILQALEQLKDLKKSENKTVDNK